MTDIYKRYNFKFYEAESIALFKEALKSKGLDKQGFIKLVLDEYPNKSKDTLGEYYDRRLCTDTEILDLLHNKLKLSLQDIYLPNSVYKYEGKRIVFSNAFLDSPQSIEILGNINLVLYNCDNLTEKSTDEEKENYYFSLKELLMCYSYFNYLIQKYIYSYLSNNEFKTLKTLGGMLIYGKKTVLSFIDSCQKDEDIFKKIYLNNTLTLFEGKKHYLLDYHKVFNIFEGEKLMDVLSIIPPKEKNILLSIYKNTNNKKVVKALEELGAKTIERSDIPSHINDNEVENVINTLIDKEVLFHA